MKKRFLITGGAGFIGRSLVIALAEKENHIRVFDNFSRVDNHHFSFPENIEMIQGDIRNIEKVKEVMKDVDTVIHLAAINGTESFYEKPELVLEVATKGILNVLDACVECGIKEIYTASSSEVYHVPDIIPTPEVVPLIIPDILNPRYSYSGSKIISELLMINYGKRYFDRAILFRPHNVYGPNMGIKHVIPQFIEKIQSLRNVSEKKFHIQGTGKETRSFVYIDDFVKGVLNIIEQGEHLNVYHIGTEEEISIESLALKIGNLMKMELAIIPGTLTAGSPVRRCPDISKIKNLGYNPAISLENGLSKTIEWYLSNN